MAGQSSFAIHLPAAFLVLLTAWLLRCEIWQWCALLLSIAAVLSTELMNSAVESLAKGVCREQNQQVGAALDIASAAVLVASLLSAAIGIIIFAMQIFT